jgi:tape measure domain-containing protein
MAGGSTLMLKLGIDVSNLSRELGKVEKTMSKFGNNMRNIGTTMTQSITMPLIGVGAASLKAFADMERLELGLTAIMGSSEGAKDELTKLRKVAENPGLALPQVVKASATLQSVGMSADAARETITQFGNAVARASGTPDDFEGVVRALGQISAVGKVTQEDLNQIKERLPEFADVMKNEFGTATAEGIRAMNISSEDFIKRTVAALSELERGQGGLSNSFDNLKDNVTLSLAELGRTINESLKLEEVFARVSEKIQMLVDKFKALTPQQQENIVKFGLIAAAIGPLLLLIGQFATSISAIIGLTKTLIATFTVLSGGTYLLVAAIGALVAYYATTDEGQKSLSKTGILLSESFDRIKKAFSKTLELLSKLQPLFDILLYVFGKIVVFSFEVVISQINAVLEAINFVYDGAVNILETLRLINKQKVKPEIDMGWGGGSAGKPSGAGASWGEETKKTIAPVDTPEVAAMKAKIKALEESLLKNNNKTKKEPKVDKKLFEFNEFKTLSDTAKAREELNKSVVSDIAPKLREQLGLTENGLVTMKNAASDVLAFGKRLKENPPQMAKPFTEADAAAIALEEKIKSLKLAFDDFNLGLQNIIEGTLNDLAGSLGTELGNALSGAGFSINSFLVPLADALINVGKLAVATGISIEGIKVALKSLNPVVAIAGGIALIALGTLVKNKLAAPKLAQGGLAYAPTMAMVGDNRNARVDPEVIAPLSKLKSMLGDVGGMGGVLETRISGNDLIILLNRSQKTLNRVQ